MTFKIDNNWQTPAEMIGKTPYAFVALDELQDGSIIVEVVEGVTQFLTAFPNAKEVFGDWSSQIKTKLAYANAQGGNGLERMISATGNPA